MAMKKPMKRAKRYDDGGDVATDEPMTRRVRFNDDGTRTQSLAEQIASRQQTGGDESTFKQKGLDISNKEEPVGFFERIRMGNIDQPGTEAYNRFGAGRGRAAAPVPVVPRPTATPPAPMSTSRPLSDDMYSDTGSSTGRGAAGTSETIAPTRPAPMKTTAPAAKPVTKPTPESMPVPSLIDRSKPVGTGNQRGPTAEELAAYTAKKNAAPAKPSMDIPKMKSDAKAALDEDPTSLLGAGAAAAAGLYGASKLGKLFKGAKKAAEKASPYIKEIGMEKKKLGRPASDVTDVVAKKRGGKIMKYASGGMVGSASKRADGIASKGKTRCKIC